MSELSASTVPDFQRRSFQRIVGINLVTGFSLIELLATLAIIAIALLGIGSALANSIQQLQHHRHANVALFLLQDMAEQSRRQSRLDASPEQHQQARRGVNFASIDRWQRSVSEQLPDGSGEIIPDGNQWLIKLSWRSQTTASDPASCPNQERRANLACLSLKVPR